MIGSSLHQLRASASIYRRAVLFGTVLALVFCLADFLLRVAVIPRSDASPRAMTSAAALPVVLDPAAAAAEVKVWAPGEISMQETVTFDIRLEAVFGSGSGRKAVLAFVPSSGGAPERHVIGHNGEAKGWVLQSFARGSVTVKRDDEEKTLTMFPGNISAASP